MASDGDLERDLLLQYLQNTRVPNPNPTAAQSLVAGEPPPGTGYVPPTEPATTSTPEKKKYGFEMGQYGLEGYDPTKLTSGHDSAKYQIGRTLSQFDPTKGITPDVVDALNSLGIGTFSSEGKDRFTVTGGSKGLRGTTVVDAIRDYGPGGANAWQYGVESDDEIKPGAGGGLSMAAAGPSTMSKIMPTDRDFYNRLQQQLLSILGGESAVDRGALLQMLGAS